MPYYPPAAAAGITSPVATDPLTFSGAVTFSKEVVVSNGSAGSSVTGTTAGQKVLLVKGAASQSVNIFEVQDSSANVQAHVHPSTGLYSSNWMEAAGGNGAGSASSVKIGAVAANGTTAGIRVADAYMWRSAAGVLAFAPNNTVAGITAPTMTGFGMILRDVSAAPSTNPVGGPVIYAEAGALKVRGTAGTVTTIAPA